MASVNPPARAPSGRLQGPKSAAGPRVPHAFTVDVEDWHQGIPVDETVKSSASWRLADSLNRLLAIMDERGVLGTFFWLGPAAERHPDLVRRVAQAGHELGSHGWSHDLIYRMSRERFKEETKRASEVVSELGGKQVTAYRAAYFSITARSMWALEILAELGIRYDSSIFPIRNWRYGIPGFDPRPQLLSTPQGPIYELPISVRRVMGLTIPASGGAYFRLYPYEFTRRNFWDAERAGRPVVFYVHPWELDPGHPRVDFDRRAKLTHYVRLKTTEPKLRRLLREFAFEPLGNVLERVLPGSGNL